MLMERLIQKVRVGTILVTPYHTMIEQEYNLASKCPVTTQNMKLSSAV